MLQRVAGRGRSANRSLSPAPNVGRAHRSVAVVLAVLVLVQAVVAGQAIFGSWDIEVHGWLGNASFLAGLLLVVLAVRGGGGRVVVVLAVALAVALFVQIGLGYAGRTALAAASVHVPLGVAIFGLSVANVLLVWAPSLAGGAVDVEAPRTEQRR